MNWQPVSWRWVNPTLHKRLMVRLERSDGRRGFDRIVYVRHAADNWSEGGDVKGWDGDLDAPTLSPSLLFKNASGEDLWHGYLRRGEFVQA